MPAAVSDSSTLIHLALLGRLDLLREFYDEVLIPPAVWKEVVEQGHGRAGAREVEEAEAIALAVQRDADAVLLDESHARSKAGVYRVRKTGVIGLLIRAKVEGKVPSLRQELDRLRQKAGFRMSENLYQQALKAVNEDLT